MPRLVISTVGTSILTNQIKRTEQNLASRLQATTNYTVEEVRKYHEDVSGIIQTLKQRAEEKLYGDDTDIDAIREASAELNGIYGLYDKQLEQGTQDVHWLITTDTAQGQVAAEILRDFLRKSKIVADFYTPKELSTLSTEKFTNGIDELLKWMDDIIPGYKNSGYTTCFNLVGGFKALQGYANTIGMFYNFNEMIYVFEGSSEIIKIPRLPIKIDKSVIKAVEFALMATEVDVWIKLTKLQDVPETLLFTVGDEAKLSHWGRLTWNNCKQEFFTGELLDFPCLAYDKSFIKDYQKNNVDIQRKVDLQDVLAEVSASMLKFKGDSTRFDPRLHFTRYEGGQRCEGGLKKNQIDHFYIKNTGWRVSCLAKDAQLYLRHYGEHDYVNNNP